MINKQENLYKSLSKSQNILVSGSTLALFFLFKKNISVLFVNNEDSLYKILLIYLKCNLKKFWTKYEQCLIYTKLLFKLEFIMYIFTIQMYPNLLKKILILQIQQH